MTTSEWNDPRVPHTYRGVPVTDKERAVAKAMCRALGQDEDEFVLDENGWYVSRWAANLDEVRRLVAALEVLLP